MSPWVWLGIAVAGSAGAACRYLLDYAITQRTGGPLPWGTFAVNITGSLALGVIVGLMLQRGINPEIKIILAGGFLGAYTTFSTWMYESLRLIEQNAWRVAMVNLLGGTLAGGLAAGAGLLLGGSL